MKKSLIVLLILGCCSPTYAASWIDSLKSFLGGEEEKTESRPEEEMTNTVDAVKSIALDGGAAGSLTAMITSQLGVSTKQAEGGLGSLFGLAQSALGAQEFSQLSQFVPEMDMLLAAAPAVSNSLGGMSLPGDLNKYANVAGSAATAYSQFSKLGLSTADIPRYIQVTNQFFNSQGGKDAASLFMESMSGLGGE